MNLNVFCLKEEERNVANAIEASGHCVAEVSFVGNKSFKCLNQI